MPEIISGTPIVWAGQQCTVATTGPGAAPLKAIFNQGTFTKTSEMEEIKDQRGDIITRVWHGFKTTLKLVGFPTGASFTEAAQQRLPNLGDRLHVDFGVDDERTAYYEVTGADNATTNVSNTAWTLDLVESVDQTTP